MPSKGTAGGDSYLAYNTSTGVYVTGDVANHTIRFLQDGAEATPTNSPTEPDATNLPGHYVITWTSAEANFNVLTIGGKSSTLNVIIIPKTIGFENLPTAATNTSQAQFGVNLVTILGAPVQTSSAQMGVNVIQYNSRTAQTDANNLPKVDVEDIVGTAVQTSAAQFGVNVIQYNSQTAQTDANNLPKVDIEDIAGAAVNTNTAQLGVNIVNIRGAAAVTSSAQLGVNVVTYAGSPVLVPAVAGVPKVDVVDINGVAAATSAAQLGVNLVTINGANTVTSSAQLGVNLVTWGGAVPAPLIAGLVQATVSGSANVNVTQWAGGNVPAPNVTGEPLVDVNHWRGTQPNTLVSNRVDSSVGALAAGVIVNTSFGTGALTTACFATNFFTAALLDVTAGNAIADDLLDRANAIESSITPRQAWRYTAAAEAGVTAGALTPTFTIAAIGNAGTNRISASTDQSGNRLSVTLN